ncbi:EmrB/QacA subfamily drug resistance transporter [Scopulibacillus darangshiensis]|uniref:EmrB/QacA subfamily drug resistance transporter n=1 Tax=Scopulibacillus darangshiensis TaxID=442528 RepID=A0A4R2NF14_9BACL|nr:DHA2 family efflux MFS transporter permease subunit [Scopulibacillus darangshiensis]TCP19748.1 EmrB/QacA subfamily drug resistance transporter [Scopulibacillus darangshiensis]
MAPFLSGYIIFVILVLVGMNLIIRRRRKLNKAQLSNSGMAPKPSSEEDSLTDNQTQEAQVRHQEALEENVEDFVTNGNPDDIDEVRESLGTIEEESKQDLSNKSRSKRTRSKKASSEVEDDTEIKPVQIIAVLIMGAFVAILNQTLMNVALPHMMSDLNVTTNTAQWLITGYMLVNGVLIPITAFLMETFSTRKLFIFAMSSFAVGTLICAISPSFSVLMAGRVVQAIGAGIIMPLMTNVMLTIFPPEKRGVAMGTMGVAMIFAPAIGPTLSGYIVENYSWRLLFYVVLPIAILDIILATIFLRNVGKLSFPKFDFLGVVFSSIGFGGVLYAFSEAGNSGWTSAEVMITLIVGIIALILLVWRELTIKNPMLEFRVFKHNIFALTTVVNAVITMAMFAGMLLVPIYLQNIRGFTPLQSGLLLLPGAILMGIMSPITGALFDKIGARPLAIVGLSITTITTWEFGHLSDATTYGHIMFLYASRMFGMSLLMMPIMTEGLNNLPRHLNSHGTAMANTMRQVAGSLGTAFLVTVMSNRTSFHAANYADNISSSNANISNQLDAMGKGVESTMNLPHGSGHGLVTQMLYGNVMKEATIQGINDAFIVATGLAALALVLSFFVRRSTPSKKQAKNKEIKVETSEPATES